MNFTYTEDQTILRDTIRHFAETEIAPHVLDWDERQYFPIDIVPRLSELGVMGVLFPDVYGGAGMSYSDYVIVIEELSRVDASIGIFIAAHNSLGANHIFSCGTERQKQRYLRDLASGRKIAAWGLTETGAGSDAGGTKTTAVQDGTDYVLNGSKTFITNATIADTYVLMAVTNPPAGHQGISAFILERGMPGLAIGKKENKLGLRASDTASIILEDCRVPKDNLLGEEGHGFSDSLKILDGGRISIAAMALGIAQGAYENSIKYARQRQQFGRAIAEFQAIRFKLADMAVEIDAARLLTFRAAELKQAGLRCTKEASMAKLYAGEVAVRAGNEAVQIHGGYGFTKDFPVEKFYRDAKLCTIGEGTSEIQRMVIARQILR